MNIKCLQEAINRHYYLKVASLVSIAILMLILFVGQYSYHEKQRAYIKQCRNINGVALYIENNPEVWQCIPLPKHPIE